MVCRFFTGLAGFVAFALTPWTGATPTEGHKIMMAGPSAYAIEVGREISARGGNAIDVAVAMGLSLTVTSPYFGALGGGGFALLKMKGGVEVLDFRETAPAATFPDYFKNLPEDASVNGGHAVGVPGWPAGLYALHRKHGVLKWKDLFVRPVEMAEKGFRVTGEWVAKTNGNVDRFNAAGKKYFRKAGNTAYKPGEILKQKSLGLALQKFRDLGPSGFYQGSVAADIVKSVQAAGGKMTVADLKSYKVRWLTPLEAQYAGYKIYLMPPPSSGGIVIKSALSLMEVMGRKDLAPLSVEELHWLAEIEKRAYRGRALLGDPDFYKNPLNMLASDKYLREMADSFSRRKATSLKPLSPRDIKESTETTHYSVLDSNGNAVAITVTLNGSYGSGVVSDRFGIALNNEMDDFTIQLGEANM